MFTALAKHLGCVVTTAGRGEERLRTARRLGAEVFDVAGDTDLPDAIGRKFDIVVEAVGKPEVWEAAVRMVRKGGAVNFFGGCPAGTFVKLDTGLIHYSNLRMLASFHHTPRTVRRALAFIEEGVIGAGDFVTGRCRLAELPQVFSEMAQGNRAVKTLVETFSD
jgi:L-iditol 2-dehydrogenase